MLDATETISRLSTSPRPISPLPMDSSQHVFRDDTHNSSVAFPGNAENNDYLSSDLTARLQNVGARVRKSVTEGYATNRFTSTPSAAPRGFTRSATTPHLFTDRSPIFRSASDTLHAVYGQHSGPRKPPSQLKRDHEAALMEEDLDDAASANADMEQSRGDAETGGSALSQSHDLPSRPVKPLRRAARPFRQTQSMPASAFGAAVGRDPVAVAPSPALPEVEEDWSALNFPGAS